MIAFWSFGFDAVIDMGIINEWINMSGQEQKSELEIKYEEYLEQDNNTKTIDGVTYFRAIHISEIKIKSRKRMLAIFPWEVFEGGKTETMRDENGN